MASVYETFYGLSTDPFRLSPDYRFSFEHPSYKKAKAYMQYALNRSEGFLLVTGTSGTGKTTLIHDIVSRINDAYFTVISLLSTRLRPDEMLHMIAMSLGVSCDELQDSALRPGIEKALIRQYRSRRRVVLMVDEAQDLSLDVLEELRLLSELQLGGQLLLQIFLLGQQPLLQLVNRPGMEHLRERIIAATHLKPMSEEDTAAFMVYRLMRAGWRKDPVITSQALSSIYDYSGGVPRLINQVCSRLLLLGAIEEQHTLDRDAAENVIDGIYEEMLFGDAATNPQPGKNRPSSESRTIVYQEIPATPVTVAVAEKWLQPRAQGAALSAYVDVVAEGFDSFQDLETPVPEPGEQMATRLATPDTRQTGPSPKQHYVPFIIVLLVVSAIGYQLRITGSFTDWGLLLQWLQVVEAPINNSIERNSVLSEDSSVTQQDQTDIEMILATVQKPVLTAKSPDPALDKIPIGNLDAAPSRTMVARKSKLAAEPEPEISLMAVETTDAFDRSVHVAARMNEFAILTNTQTKNATGTGMAGLSTGHRHANPGEVQAWLDAGHWRVSEKPAVLLPSTVSRCQKHDHRMMCWSAPQHVVSDRKNVIYQVQSTIDSFSGGGVFKVRYRVMESVLSVKGPEMPDGRQVNVKAEQPLMKQETTCRAIDSSLIRCRGAVDAVFRLGWKVIEQETNCKAIGSRLIRCRGRTEGIFKLGWKVIEQELMCKAIDPNLIQCLGEAGDALSYRRNN